MKENHVKFVFTIYYDYKTILLCLIDKIHLNLILVSSYFMNQQIAQQNGDNVNHHPLAQSRVTDNYEYDDGDLEDDKVEHYQTS